ncbi:DUF3231 family protein [Evansella sp. AB-P1]|uniref:DUF3231 family protein n=1 Tax=Evansella sp. AB-P1 TaxID=3037653 RepID=UPI00241F35D4|nr:DUF3231 family protein [Evansella sp. AB-P1]MDG5789365.1 DUF3231 family protein [Evansella sp. AB-P1]
MDNGRIIKLTSAEIAALWSMYMADSGSICLFKHFLQNVDDQDVKPEMEFALDIAEKHIVELKRIFEIEGIPSPIGFNEETDLNIKAPRLYSDTFYMYFLLNTAKNGFATYGMAAGVATRKDMLNLFNMAIDQCQEINNRVTNVMLQKGIYIKPPSMDLKHRANYVAKESYLRGWFGQRRTLSATEVTHLYLNHYNNALGKALLMGFSQVAQTPEVRDYFIRGHDIARKHVDILSSILHESSEPAPMMWDTDVMESTIPPFSEKLMMFITGGISAMGIANYGGSMSQTFRHDIAVHYLKMLSEAGLFAEDGASIMINHGWFERPPQTIDREFITKGQ